MLIQSSIIILPGSDHNFFSCKSVGHPNYFILILTDAFNVIFFPVISVLDDPVIFTPLTFTLEEEGTVVEVPVRSKDARVVIASTFVPVFVSGVQLPFPNTT